MMLHRWYRRTEIDLHTDEVRHSYRRPVELGAYSNSTRPKVKYRMLGAYSGCSGIAWLRWAKKATIMPEGFEPEGFVPMDADDEY